MSLQISKAVGTCAMAAALAVALSACSDTSDAGGQAATTGGEAKADNADTAVPDTIPCALNGASEMQTVCKHSVIGSGDSAQLLLEGPEGDFRRFNILTDGRGLEPSDGAEPAAIKLLDGGKIEVTVGDDIFVLPAKVKPSVAEALPASDAAPATEPAPQ